MKKWNGGSGSTATRPAHRLRVGGASLLGVGLGEIGEGPRVLRLDREHALEDARRLDEVAVAQVDDAQGVEHAVERRVAAHAFGGPRVGVVEPARRERFGGAVVGVHGDDRRLLDLARAQAADVLGRQEVDRDRCEVARRLGVDDAAADGDVDVARRDQEIAAAAPRLVEKAAR